MQGILNFSLLVLSIILIALLGKEAFELFNLAFFHQYHSNQKELLECILTFFLYFEFISMIIKYFRENYHFPLRYFMYIGITATIRFIVVDHGSAIQTLYLSGAILFMVISYAIIQLLSNSRKDK